MTLLRMSTYGDLSFTTGCYLASFLSHLNCTLSFQSEKATLVLLLDRCSPYSSEGLPARTLAALLSLALDTGITGSYSLGAPVFFSLL